MHKLLSLAPIALMLSATFAFAESPPATDPQAFATKAAIGNLFEIQSSQLALKQSTTPVVTMFAQKMIDDHTAAAEQMKPAAQADKVSIPIALDELHAEEISQLQTLKGDAFEKAYIPMQALAHDQAVTLFQGYAEAGKAGALTDFAAKTLPTLQMHQQMIHAMAER